MNQEKYKKCFEEHIKEIYKLPEKTKIIFFKDPIDYKVEFIEDINPNHIKIIYGKKWDIKSNCEKIAKIIVPSIIFSELLIISCYLTLIILGLFSSFITIGLFTSNYYKIFFNYFFKFYNYYGCDIIESRKYGYRYLWA